MEVEITADVQVWCEKCGNPLCSVSSVEVKGGTSIRVYAGPCQKCLDEAYEKGVDYGRA
ncbi:MAG: hypothetical protein M0R06_01410 [Sphaerochaeta sp.]|jgi:hypothetical protein|nr:hypothetical protein [Sphaerochaeta sp.]